MILKGSQRGGALQLANHLMNSVDNDHVEVHAVEGFIASDVHGALQEAYAVSRATKATQFMFSLSLSPPEDAYVSVESYENAIERAADALGLAGQPRVVIFHEKKGRRHCHVVLSRIDIDRMAAINLPFYKDRLYTLSRELFLEHGWDMPKGLRSRLLSDPRNYSLEEYQIALRAKRDPREIKAVLQACWQRSDDSRSFEAALAERGFFLARGDQRSFVVLHWHDPDTVYSLSRWAKTKPSLLHKRLGDSEKLPTLDEVRVRIAQTLTMKHDEFRARVEAEFAARFSAIERECHRLVAAQQAERRSLTVAQNARREQETVDRNRRFRKGVLGLWDWVTGRRRELLRRARAEADAAIERNRREVADLILHHRQAMVPLVKKRHAIERDRKAKFTYLAKHESTLIGIGYGELRRNDLEIQIG